MPIKLEGSCRCGAVHFTVQSHTPCPYQLCYCTICLGKSSASAMTTVYRSLAAVLELIYQRNRICA